MCEYKNGTFQCKNWVPSAKDDEVVLCAFHAGIIKREPSEQEIRFQQRFAQHLSFRESMSDQQLTEDALQLESLIEDIKLRIQANAHERQKRVKNKSLSEILTDEQKAEIARLRDPHRKMQAQEQAVTKQEKEIAKIMRHSGMTREKALKLLGLD